MKICGFLAAVLLACAPARSAPTIIEGVHGYTLAGDELRRFDALAFESGKIVDLGAAASLRARFPDAPVIDGDGATLLPGLIDAHGHVLALGTRRTDIDLTGTRTLAEAQQRVRAYAAAHPGRAWLQGGGWNQVIWNLGRFPRSTELDAAVADRPVILGRIDGHAQWLNTRALRAAGISRDTPDPAGGRIERDAHGNPTGVLIDKAMALTKRVRPAASSAARRCARRSRT